MGISSEQLQQLQLQNKFANNTQNISEIFNMQQCAGFQDSNTVDLLGLGDEPQQFIQIPKQEVRYQSPTLLAKPSNQQSENILSQSIIMPNKKPIFEDNQTINKLERISQVNQQNINDNLLDINLTNQNQFHQQNANNSDKNQQQFNYSPNQGVIQSNHSQQPPDNFNLQQKQQKPEQNNQQTEGNIGLKLMEKLILNQMDSKIKEVKFYGQIMIEGEFQQDVIDLELQGTHWEGEKSANKRKTPNTVPIKELSATHYKIKVDKQKFTQPKGIIDYIMPADLFFNPSLIPLYFIYKQENHPNKPDIRYLCQYKINEKWNTPIYDVDIELVFDNELIFSDIKMQPQANSFQNKTVVWKSKQPSQKGNLMVQIEGINLKPQQTLKFIKIAMRSTQHIGNLDAQLVANGQKVQAQKKLLVEYKINPNTN